MPIYEYECQKCGEVFETIRKFSDPPLKKCLCGKKGSVKKLVSAAAFHLKGGGWYVTDFRDKNKKKDGADTATKEAATDATSTSSSSDKKDTKADKKKSDTTTSSAAAD